MREAVLAMANGCFVLTRRTELSHGHMSHVPLPLANASAFVLSSDRPARRPLAGVATEVE